MPELANGLLFVIVPIDVIIFRICKVTYRLPITQFLILTEGFIIESNTKFILVLEAIDNVI